MGEVLTIVLIISTLVILMIAAIVGYYISQTAKSPSLVTLSGVGLLQSCVTDQCAPGLICDGFSFLCKKGPGASCDIFAECATGLFCSGICVTGPTGFLNQYCPCDQDYRCMLVNEISGLTECKSFSSTCGSDLDCVSFKCDAGHCRPGFPLAFPCTLGEQCESGNCSFGFCQLPGITTGNRGAACAAPCTLYSGAICANGTVCHCGATATEPGICSLPTAGLLSNCTRDILCAPSYICRGTGPSCLPGESCACQFDYPDANHISTTLSCISGMKAIEQNCYNDLNFGCQTNSQCASNFCSLSQPSFVYYSFASGIFQGSMTTSLLRGSSPPLASFTAFLPGSPMMPYKSFPGSGNSFYLVDHNYGLLFCSGPRWFQLIPRSSSYGVLIDAAFGSFALAAFNQGAYDLVYSGSDFNNLAPFNPLSGAGPTGTQYDLSHDPISITYLDGSLQGSVLISNAIGTVYSKSSTATLYNIQTIIGGTFNGQQMLGTTGPVRYYSGSTGNIAYVHPSGDTAPLLFSGDLATIELPLTDQTCQVYDFAMLGSMIILLVNYYQGSVYQFSNVILYQAGSSVAVPYQINESYRSVITNSLYGLIAPGTCS